MTILTPTLLDARISKKLEMDATSTSVYRPPSSTYRSSRRLIAGPAAATAVMASSMTSSIVRHQQPPAPLVRNTTFVEARRYHRHQLQRVLHHRKTSTTETSMRHVDFADSIPIQATKVVQPSPPAGRHHHFLFPSIQLPASGPSGEHRDTHRDPFRITSHDDQQVAKRYRLNRQSTNLTATFKSRDTLRQLPGERLLPVDFLDEPSTPGRYKVRRSDDRMKTFGSHAATTNGKKITKQIETGKGNGNPENGLEFPMGSLGCKTLADGTPRAQRKRVDAVSERIVTSHPVDRLHGGTDPGSKELHERSKKKLLTLIRAANITTGNSMATVTTPKFEDSFVARSRTIANVPYNNIKATTDFQHGVNGMEFDESLCSTTIEVYTSRETHAPLEITTGIESEQFEATPSGVVDSCDETNRRVQRRHRDSLTQPSESNQRHSTNGAALNDAALKGDEKRTVLPEIRLVLDDRTATDQSINDDYVNLDDNRKNLNENRFKPVSGIYDQPHQRQTDRERTEEAGNDPNVQKTVLKPGSTRQPTVWKFRQPVTTRLQTFRCATPVREKIRQFKQLHELQRLEKLHHMKSIQPSVALAIEISTDHNAVTCLQMAPPNEDVMRRKSSPTTTWRTWRDVNQSDVYTDVGEYIRANSLMPDDRRKRIEEWIEQSWNSLKDANCHDNEERCRSPVADTCNGMTSSTNNVDPATDGGPATT